jgi:hypothetical protein
LCSIEYQNKNLCLDCVEIITKNNKNIPLLPGFFKKNQFKFEKKQFNPDKIVEIYPDDLYPDEINAITQPKQFLFSNNVQQQYNPNILSNSFDKINKLPRQLREQNQFPFESDYQQQYNPNKSPNPF